VDYVWLINVSNTKRRKSMNKLWSVGSYLLVFLLGWSGAVWTYSDLIYKKVETPAQTTSSSESPVGDSEQPPVGDSEQPIEEQIIDQDAQPVQK
jgi:flagellar biosynthesis/type III secretory pathway M-ring protein FliF/YscJ